jgi:hypothetical protein
MSALFEEKRELMLTTFPSRVTKSDGRMEVKAIYTSGGYSCSLLDQSVGESTGVDAKITRASLTPDIYIYFYNAYVLFAQMLIKIFHLLHIIQLHVSKLPCGTHTKSNRNMQIVIIERECLIVVCKAYVVQQPFVNQQK